MKKKLVIAFVLSLIWGTLVISQTSYAKGIIHNSTVPATSPITSPISYYSLSGKVTLRAQTGANRVLIYAAKFLNVHAVNLTTNQDFLTKTDINGNYVFNLSAGSYKVIPEVTPENVNKLKFSPSYSLISLYKTIGNINFLGYYINGWRLM